MKYILISVIAVLSLVSSVRAQSKISTYQKEPSLLKKSVIALDLWEYYSRYSIDSLYIIGFELLQKNSKENNPFVEAVAKRMLGCFEVRNKSIVDGLKLLHSSKSIFLNNGDNRLIAEAYNELGIAYFLMGEMASAKENFKISLEYGEKSSRPTLAYMAEINLAKCILQEGDLLYSKRLIEHYVRCAERDEKYEAVANAYSLLGQIALDEEKVKRASWCFNKQLESAIKTNAPFIVTRAHSNQAILLFMDKNYTQSLNMFKEVLEKRKEQGFHSYTCEAYMNLASFHYERGNVPLGNRYIDSSYTLAQEHGLLQTRIESLELKQDYVNSDRLEKRISKLQHEQDQLISERKRQRNELRKKVKKEAKEGEKTTYAFLLLICVPIILWVIYKR